MLTENEKKGITHLLKRLEPADLHAITATVTKRTVVPDSVLDAIDIIISQTSETKELLQRKKIKRDVLMAYCITERIRVASNADKDTLVNLVTEYWSQSQNTDYSEAVKYEVENAGYSNSEPEQQSVDALPVHFVNWFYTMFNQPPFANTGGDNFGPHHFWPDAQLNVAIISADDPQGVQQVITASGAADVVYTLVNLLKVPNIILNPNVPQGVTGCHEPHGLVVVLVRGTIHQSTTLKGVFEQSFGIARDPMSENKWKIKTTTLKMREAPAGHQLPSLLAS